jgi:hypothetical protein
MAAQCLAIQGPVAIGVSGIGEVVADRLIRVPVEAVHIREEAAVRAAPVEVEQHLRLAIAIQIPDAYRVPLVSSRSALVAVADLGQIVVQRRAVAADRQPHLRGENDGLNWPHCDGLNWPHLRPIVA